MRALKLKSTRRFFAPAHLDGLSRERLRQLSMQLHLNDNDIVAVHNVFLILR
jgi:hypothetical protein